jgi:TP901 family phage tail tape measure protein
MAEKIGDAYVQIGANIKDFQSKMATVQKDLKSTGQAFSRFGKQMALRVTAPVAAAATASVRAFSSFGAAMRNVNTIAKESEEQFRATKKQVLEMSTAMGKQPTDMADALYNINSAGFVAQKGLTVLEQAAKAGTAGVSDTATAAKAITGVLNAYSMQAGAAGDVSDILFKTVEKGVVTFPELAQNLGNVIGSAASAKIPFEQVAAALATITKGGIGASEATTSLSRLMMAFIQPAESMAQAIKLTGYESGAALLKQRGLAGAMQFLQDATGGEAEKLVQLGINIRAFKAAAALARNEGRDFAMDLGEIANQTSRAGATQAAYEEQSKSLAFRLQKVKAELVAMGIAIGETLLPLMEQLTTALHAITSWYGNLSKAQKDLISKVAIFAAAIGPVLIAMGAMIKSAGLVAAAVRGVGLAFKIAFSGAMGPVGWVLGAIGLLVAGVAALRRKLGKNKVEAASVVDPKITKEVEDIQKQITKVTEQGAEDRVKISDQAALKEILTAKQKGKEKVKVTKETEEKVRAEQAKTYLQMASITQQASIVQQRLLDSLKTEPSVSRPAKKDWTAPTVTDRAVTAESIALQKRMLDESKKTREATEKIATQTKVQAAVVV